MARSKQFFHAVWSGYTLTISMSVLSLLVIPFALSALGKVGFGLWSAVAQVTAFTMVLDLGMGPSLSRFLIDYKDDRNNPDYANFLKSVFSISLIQSVLFGALMFALIPHLPRLVGIESEQHNLFKSLLYWQLVPTALSFPLKPFSLLLYAHQHIAKLNGCSLVSAVASAGTLLFGLQSGWGVYSYIISSWVTFLVMQSGVLFYVSKFNLIPPIRKAQVSFKSLKPLLSFSSNVFLIAIGGRLINFAPTLLVTRHLGVTAFADWTVGTRLVSFVSQLADRIPNSAEPALWEMFKRRELPLMRQRWAEVILLAVSSTAFLVGGVVAINPSFIDVWTSSEVLWRTNADILLAIWIIAVIASNCLNMAPGITKRLGSMKYVYLSEGCALLAIAYLPITHLQSHQQIAAILLSAVCLFRVPYGWFRTYQDLEISLSFLVMTLLRVFGAVLLLLLLAFGIRQATVSLNPITQLIVNGVVYFVFAMVTVYFVGLPQEFRKRINGTVKCFFFKPKFTPAKPPHKDDHIEMQ